MKKVKSNILYRVFIVFLMVMYCYSLNVEAAPILKLNSHGHDVVVLQQNLVKLKYKISKISGKYDNETQDAVKAFQKDHKINVTGIVNRETWWAIKGEQSTKQNTKSKSTSSKSDKKYKPNDTINKNEVLIWDNLSSVPYGKEFLSSKEASLIISTAKNYIGVPYVFGGDTPNGFDCSGYLEYVFAKNGIQIPRTADEQYKLGKLVKTSQLKPGDLVFFTTYEPGASHCGIYLGNNNFIHASTSKGVRIDDLNNSYWSARYYGGKHIVK